MDFYREFSDSKISLDEYMQFKEKQYKHGGQGTCPEDVKAMFRDEVRLSIRFKLGIIFRDD